MRRLAVRAARVALGVSLVVAVAVGLMHLFPGLAFSYPLVLVPLLAVGPLVAGRSAGNVREATLAGLVAGAISGVAVALVLAAAASLLNDFRWTFVAPATRPPVPPLPRPQFIPFLSWPQHYLLLLQPPLAALMAALHAALFDPGARLAITLERLTASIPASVHLKIGALLLIHASLTALVGWVSFTAIEELHFRGHSFQFQLDWQTHVSELDRAVDAEDRVLRLLASGGDPRAEDDLAVARREFATTAQHLLSSPAHPALTVGRSTMVEIADRYRPLVERAVAAEGDLAAVFVQRANPRADVSEMDQRAFRLRQALRDLGVAVTGDTVSAADAADVAHHVNLFTIFGLVILAIGSGLVLGRISARAITRPIGLVSGHLVQLASGNFTGRIWVANRDELGALVTRANEVTAELDELYRREQQARVAAEALAGRERALAETKEFLAHTIVHDLKHPLTAIMGYAELLDAGGFGALQDRQAEAVRTLMAQSERLLNLANDVVETFRLEHDALPLARTEEQPATLLASALSSVSTLTTRAPELDLEPDLPVVSVDRRLFLRVVGNLISNAYQHAGKDAAVRVGARRREDGVVLFWVEDDGPGITLEDRNRIFDRFVQGKRTRAGSGLGLAFCKLIVERHGGSIWVEDAPGGARFSFTVSAGGADSASARTPIE